MRMLRGMVVLSGLVLAGSSPALLAQFPPAPCNSPVCNSSVGTSPVSPATNRGQSGPPLQHGIDMPPQGPLEGRLERDQAKLRNADRQKQLEADTQKLLALANELKAEVEKSNKDTLSLDVVRKADEIEKLAKSVRDKMRGS